VLILRRTDGDLTILNHDELKLRSDTWLQSANIDSSLCGSWYFTWNAFQIVCDPNSVISLIKPLNLRINLKNGELYSEPSAISENPLVLLENNLNSRAYRVDLELDPNTIREEKAETNRIVSEISGTTSPLIKGKASGDPPPQYRGDIQITFRTNPAEQVMEKTSVATIVTSFADGRTEQETATTVIRRSLQSSRN